MNNFEFHKDAIESLYRVNASFGLSERGVIAICSNIGCTKCMFSLSHNPHTEGLSCGDRKMLWALKEYVEKPKLTKQERKFCELFEGKELWFAKDKTNKYVTTYKTMPEKRDKWWYGNSVPSVDLRSVCGVKFDFIKFEDEKPWSVAELLKLEVIE